MKVSRLRSMRFVLAAMAVVIWSAGMAGLAEATTYFAKRLGLSVQVVYGKNHNVQSFEANYTMRCTSGRKY